jgi:hypothetical protein
MSPEAQAGRRILLAYISLVLMLSIVAVTRYALKIGIERLPIHIAGFILTVLLFYWLYDGSRKAKVIAVFLTTGIALVGGKIGFLAMSLAITTGLRYHFFLGIVILATSAVHLSFAIVLLESKA